jgi:hypothetical protein
MRKRMIPCLFCKRRGLHFVNHPDGGEILDSNGQVLVGTVPTYSVYVVDPAIECRFCHKRFLVKPGGDPYERI